MPPLLGHLHRAQAGVVDDVGLAAHRVEGEAQIPHAGLADVDVDPTSRHAGAARQLNRFGRENRVAVIDLELRERCAVVADADLGADRRARQTDRGDLHIVELEIVRNHLGADTDGVHGHAEARDLGDPRCVEIIRVIRPVGHEHDRCERARLPTAQNGEQRVADMRDRPGRRNLLQRRQLRRVARERVQLDVERGLQIGQRVRGQRLDRLLQAGAISVSVEHAGRRVDQHCDGVLLRTQRLGHERRAPREHQDDCEQRRLQRAEHDELAGGETFAAAHNSGGDGRAGSDDQNHQEPNRPAARENQLASFKRGARILEQQLEQLRLPTGLEVRTGEIDRWRRTGWLQRLDRSLPSGVRSRLDLKETPFCACDARPLASVPIGPTASDFAPDRNVRGVTRRVRPP